MGVTHLTGIIIKNKTYNMSEMEFHRGILREVERLHGEDLEDLCKRLCKEQNISEPLDADDNYEDNLLNKSMREYVSVNERLFKMVEHKHFEEDNFIITKLDNGDYLFSGGFYNGGTCLSECIEENLGALLKNK